MLAGIVSLLNANSPLTTLLGNTTSIVPVGQSKGVSSPFVIYHISSGVPTYSAKGDTGLQMVRFQFDCYSSKNHLEAWNVAVALRTAIKNVINQTLSDGTFVYACVASPPVDLTMVAQGTTSIDFRVMVEVEVTFLTA